jgi:hypothetical protein
MNITGQIFNHSYTIVEDYTSTNGKFSDNLGNVALVDCHYMQDLIPFIPFDFCNVAQTINGVVSD